MCPLDFHPVWPLGRFSGDVLHAGASRATSGATSGRPSTSTGCRGRGVSAGVQSASGTRLECLNVEKEKRQTQTFLDLSFRVHRCWLVYLMEILETDDLFLLVEDLFEAYIFLWIIMLHERLHCTESFFVIHHLSKYSCCIWPKTDRNCLNPVLYYKSHWKIGKQWHHMFQIQIKMVLRNFIHVWIIMVQNPPYLTRHGLFFIRKHHLIGVRSLLDMRPYSYRLGVNTFSRTPGVKG